MVLLWWLLHIGTTDGAPHVRRYVVPPGSRRREPSNMLPKFIPSYPWVLQLRVVWKPKWWQQPLMLTTLLRVRQSTLVEQAVPLALLETPKSRPATTVACNSLLH